MINRLEHLGVLVADMDRSVRFYQDVFGLVLRKRAFNGPKTELAFLHHPTQSDFEVELICRGNSEPTEGVINHFAFRVENIQAEIDRLASLGVEMDDLAPRVILDGVKIAFFRGPDGERLEFVERD
ncbi:MAG: glyoxalase [Bacilli bacterium]|nr:glyoxalase [Bacilli bacterium]